MSATWVRSADFRLPPLGLQPSLAIGVGHITALVARFIPCFPASCDGVGFVCLFSLALALGVGQLVSPGEDEQPLALMRRANFCRRKQSFRNPVVQAFQLAADLAISEVEVIGDVFQKHPFGVAFPDDPREMRPQMAGIVDPLAFTRDRKRLARIAASNNIHRSTPRSAIEGGNVIPERCLIQGLVFHPRHESGRSVTFPLDVTDSSIAGTGNGEAEVDPSGTGAERQAEEGVTASGR